VDINDGSKLLGRRRALQILGVGLAAGGLIGLPGCKQEGSAGSAAPAPAPPAPAPAAPPPVAPAPAPTPAAPPPEAAAAPEPADAGALNCKTQVAFDENAATMRRALQYKEQSAEPLNKCVDCVQFEAGKYGACGACKLFAGAVNPGGSCLSFAPRQADAGKPG
jgi:hypothetical protein